MKIANNLTELIGNTPLVKINKLTDGNIYAKCESFNPAGSVKDRVAYNMIKDAENKGLINKNTIIIEPTSGNTGIGLAMICAIKCYKLILTMPENMSKERIKLLSAYGAKIILTPAEKGMQGSIDKANELSKKYKNSFIPQQFTNLANPQIHEKTTAQEIWKDTKGKVDIVVAGVGTGGTICGIAKTLKKKNKDIKIIAVEPKISQVLRGKKPNTHKIQGIGANFVPEIFDYNLIDNIIPVSDKDAIRTAQLLAQKEGILCGISSGAAMHIAIKLAKQNKDKNIVVILPDTGERYITSDLFK